MAAAASSWLHLSSARLNCVTQGELAAFHFGFSAFQLHGELAAFHFGFSIASIAFTFHFCVTQGELAAFHFGFSIAW